MRPLAFEARIGWALLSLVVLLIELPVGPRFLAGWAPAVAPGWWIGRRPYAPHPNIAAHHVAADAIADEIRARGLPRAPAMRAADARLDTALPH